MTVCALSEGGDFADYQPFWDARVSAVLGRPWRMQQKIHPGMIPGRGEQQAVIFLGQDLFFGAVGLMLGADIFDFALLPPEKAKAAVDRSDHRIDTAHGGSPIDQIFLIGDDQLLGDGAAVHEKTEGGGIATVLFGGNGAFFLIHKAAAKELQILGILLVCYFH